MTRNFLAIFIFSITFNTLANEPEQVMFSLDLASWTDVLEQNVRLFAVTERLSLSDARKIAKDMGLDFPGNVNLFKLLVWQLAEKTVQLSEKVVQNCVNQSDQFMGLKEKKNAVARFVCETRPSNQTKSYVFVKKDFTAKYLENLAKHPQEDRDKLNQEYSEQINKEKTELEEKLNQLRYRGIITEPRKITSNACINGVVYCIWTVEFYFEVINKNAYKNYVKKHKLFAGLQVTQQKI